MTKAVATRAAAVRRPLAAAQVLGLAALTLLDNAGQQRSGPFAILEFDTPAGIASPVLRKNPRFAGFGRTGGGAREFVIPNMSLDELTNLTIRRVP